MEVEDVASTDKMVGAEGARVCVCDGNQVYDVKQMFHINIG